MIWLRIRAGEDRQAIAKQCGTSVDMLERNYSFAIEALEDEGPKPAAEERLRARSSLLPTDIVNRGLRKQCERQAPGVTSCPASATGMS